MTVRQLRALLRSVPEGMTLDQWNDTEVLMPLNMAEFDGAFLSPCAGETGFSEMGIDEETDETRPAFVIAPHGFSEEKCGVPPELN